jgi:hypothetical protein
MCVLCEWESLFLTSIRLPANWVFPYTSKSIAGQLWIWKARSFLLARQSRLFQTYTQFETGICNLVCVLLSQDTENGFSNPSDLNETWMRISEFDQVVFSRQSSPSVESRPLTISPVGDFSTGTKTWPDTGFMGVDGGYFQSQNDGG